MRKWILPEDIEDILPAEAEAIEALRRTLLDHFRTHAYRLVQPPLVEHLDSRDESSEPVADGSRGELVVTSLMDDVAPHHLVHDLVERHLALEGVLPRAQAAGRAPGHHQDAEDLGVPDEAEVMELAADVEDAGAGLHNEGLRRVGGSPHRPPRLVVPDEAEPARDHENEEEQLAHESGQAEDLRASASASLR